MPIKKTAAQSHLAVFLSVVSLISACSTSAISNRESKTGITGSGSATQSVSPSSIPLHCQAKVLRPAKFAPHRESIRVFEPAPDYKNTPATIAWGTKRIQVEPARFRQETVPAQYQEVTETITVLRERTELKGIPAIYKTLERPVTLHPSYTHWKKGCIPQHDPTTCFVKVPRRTRILKQQIIETPAKIIQQRVPAETVSIRRKILVKPGQGSGGIIPARYINIRVGKISRVWQIEATRADVRHEVLQVQKTMRPEQIRQVAVFCVNQQADPQQISRIQQRLRQHGLAVNITGHFDPQSWRALTRFQQDNDLFIGAITAETLQRLGL
ncbi:MAG: hypothetical protein CSA79_02450 [Thiothrix nivea]|nr:MAG: hypothetical protein CSA79_02450 [Thiothrix nivea]